MSLVHRIKQYFDQFTLEQMVKDQSNIMKQAHEEFPDANDLEFTVAFMTWLNENRDDEGYTTIGYAKEE